MKKAWVLLIAMVVMLGILAAAGAEDNGWVKEGSYLCYYENGVKTTGTSTIGGIAYSFSAEGHLLGNGKIQEIEGSFYYLNGDNLIQYGWTTVSGKKYYFDPDSGKAYTGKLRGPQHQIEDEYYLFNNKGELMINGWWPQQGSAGPFFYGNDQGIVTTGYVKIGDHYYLFSETGENLSGWQVVENFLHYFSPDHDAGEGYPEVRGWIFDDQESVWYFCDLNDGRRAVNTTVTDHGYTYRFTETGVLKITENTMIFKDGNYWAIDTTGAYLWGLQKIGEDTYFFEKKTGMVTGPCCYWSQEDNCNFYYYFDADGKMETGWIKCRIYDGGNYSEGWYFFGPDGKAVFGWLIIDGATYYISEHAGSFRDGIYWLEKDGKAMNYQFDADGKLIERISADLSGWYQKNGQWFYGDIDRFLVTGLQAIDGRLYYFSDQGVMQYGWIQDGGKWYYAGSDGALYTNSWLNSGAAWYYFRGNGEMAAGWVYDSGAYYYMRDDGSMAVGWILDKGEWYYLTEGGSMYTGWLKDGNHWYLLKSSGAMATGWIQDSGTWYYLLDSGRMATGWQEINGKWEMFSAGGAWLYTWDGQ